MWGKEPHGREEDVVVGKAHDHHAVGGKDAMEAIGLEGRHGDWIHGGEEACSNHHGEWGTGCHGVGREVCNCNGRDSAVGA